MGNFTNQDEAWFKRHGFKKPERPSNGYDSREGTLGKAKVTVRAYDEADPEEGTYEIFVMPGHGMVTCSGNTLKEAVDGVSRVTGVRY
ncbi:MAG: hypothetical protein J6Y62_03985 [Clostridia bacterium]|nr:hypothetical protein [Clostridia bacterium]